jgi:hypothetical protein
VTHLFADDEGGAAARRIDRMVSRLPGLEGLRLAEVAVDAVVGSATGSRPGPDSIEATAQDRQETEERHAC